MSYHSRKLVYEQGQLKLMLQHGLTGNPRTKQRVQKVGSEMLSYIINNHGHYPSQWQAKHILSYLQHCSNHLSENTAYDRWRACIRVLNVLKKGYWTAHLNGPWTKKTK